MRHWESKAIVMCWIALLLLAPVVIIEAYLTHNAVELALGLGLTMLIYFGTGVVITLIKSWKLEEKVSQK